MRKVVRLLVILAVGLVVIYGNGHADNQPKAGADKDIVSKFLRGIQVDDKNMMYEATNLTPEVVNEARQKLIHQTQDKLTEQQRREYEHALRISGQIDFLLKKARPMFPKSASFLVMKTTTKGASKKAPERGSGSVHDVKITTQNKAEAIRDKTGKQVKEMVVYLQQRTLSVAGRPVHALSFDSKDFDKFADRNFEVLAYF